MGRVSLTMEVGEPSEQHEDDIVKKSMSCPFMLHWDQLQVGTF